MERSRCAAQTDDEADSGAAGCAPPSRVTDEVENGNLDVTLLTLLLDQSAALVAACDRHGAYVYANGAFADALGLPAGALIGQREDDLLAATENPELLRTRSAATVPTSTIEEGEIGNRRRRFLSVRHPVRSHRGEIVATCLIASELVDGTPADGEIRASLESAVERNTELRRALEQMERLAYTDRLTGAWNRRHLDDAALIEMSRAERHGFPVSVLMLDIDHFKSLNDQLGHPVGDRVLVDLVRCLRSGIRRADTITRWGGEEFIVLAPDTSLHEAERLARKLCSRVASTVVAETTSVTASIGVAEYQCGEGFDHWLARADHALYRAKTGGRNRVVADPKTSFDNRSGARPAALVQLVWRDSYCSGEESVDVQHRYLFDLSNELLEVVMSDAPPDQVLERMRHLVDATAKHFADEERLHEEIAFPERQAHAIGHAKLLEKARQMLTLAEQGNVPVANLFQFVAYEVVAQHLLGADRRYFPYLENGAAPPGGAA